MSGSKSYPFAVAMLVLIVTTATSMTVLTSGFYLLLKGVSKDEASLGLGFVIFFSELGAISGGERRHRPVLVAYRISTNGH
jgi:hypothetical protein